MLLGVCGGAKDVNTVIAIGGVRSATIATMTTYATLAVSPVELQVRISWLYSIIVQYVMLNTPACSREASSVFRSVTSTGPCGL